MKKRLMAITLTVLACLAFQVSPASAASSGYYWSNAQGTLQQGASGGEVVGLELALYSHGVDRYQTTVYGNYTATIKYSVADFEADVAVPNSCQAVGGGTSCDGIAGPSVWSYLQRELINNTGCGCQLTYYLTCHNYGGGDCDDSFYSYANYSDGCKWTDYTGGADQGGLAYSSPAQAGKYYNFYSGYGSGSFANGNPGGHSPCN